MIRTPFITLLLALALIFAAGCDRPDEDNCRLAVENIQRIAQAGDRIERADTEAAVRSCRANASRESVQCMINARTMEDLIDCEGDLAEELAGAAEDHGSSDEPPSDEPPSEPSEK
jgi:hypothetical protein